MEQARQALLAARQSFEDAGHMSNTIFEERRAHFMEVVKPFIPTIGDMRIAYINNMASNHKQYVVDFERSGQTEVGLIDDFYFVKAYTDKCGDTDLVSSSYPEQAAVLFYLMERESISYYSRCKEDFFTWEAVELAEKEGKKYVLMENMS
jgi:hypothetical protein